MSVDTVSEDLAKRNLTPAMVHGWNRRCPSCGDGPMLKSYLKVRSECPVCQEPLAHHRADDGPAYLTILIVGHIMAPILIYIYTEYEPNPIIIATTMSLGCIALSLYLLPRLKGVIVAIQWAKRMHGFGRTNSG